MNPRGGDVLAELMRGVLGMAAEDEVGFWSPPTDVYETDDGLVVAVEIAGVDPQALSVSIDKDVLTIRGVREEPARSERRNYHKMEMRFGPFLRRVHLPSSVSSSGVRAAYERGVLTVVLPRTPAGLGRSVEVPIS